MGEQWDPWNRGPQQGGQWGPPGADDRGGTPPAGAGYTPGGFTPGPFPADRPGDDLAAGRFGTAQLSEGDLVGTPPKIWLIAALVLGLAAFAGALLLGASIGWALAAWVLAGPVAIGLLALFARGDVKQRALPIYSAPGWLPALYWSAVAAAGLGVCAGAVQIALWAGYR